MWNHRIIKHVTSDSEWFAVHEVYYDDDGTPNSCTSEPIKIIQEDLKDIEWEIDKIKEALQKPVLHYSYFEELEQAVKEN